MIMAASLALSLRMQPVLSPIPADSSQLDPQCIQQPFPPLQARSGTFGAVCPQTSPFKDHAHVARNSLLTFYSPPSPTLFLPSLFLADECI